MNALVKYGLIAAAVLGFYFYNQSQDGGVSYTEDDIDLNAVLDVTIDTIYAYQEEIGGQPQDELNEDNVFVEFAGRLETSYNAAAPALHTAPIGVAPMADASVMAYEDLDGNREMGESEEALFMVEIDGENSRVIASSRSGAINDHSFSGTGLLAGYLIGSLLSRQRLAGVNTGNLANKKPVTASAAARSRARSGSHSRGK
ncbi:MAG: hypothetical protein AB8B93_04965 [Pseudomonadales bacterium]